MQFVQQQVSALPDLHAWTSADGSRCAKCKVYLRNVADDTDIDNFFYDLPSSHKGRHPLIFPAPETNPLRIVDLVKVFKEAEFDYAKDAFVYSGEHGNLLSKGWISCLTLSLPSSQSPNPTKRKDWSQRTLQSGL